MNPLAPVLVHRVADGLVCTVEGRHHRLDGATIDDLFRQEDPAAWLRARLASAPECAPPAALLPPIGAQELWAAGVTYQRSKIARMDESRQSGGDSFYDRVYSADRPELFFKSAGWRVAGPDAPVRIRRDSRWNVPEPELTLALNPSGKIFGVTIGNDMSSRDIEGENPLYLPQAKVYDGAAALGPALLVAPVGPDTVFSIRIEIHRDGRTVFAEETSTSRLKRGLAELAGWLCRELSFPHGVLLMTGTGIVPPPDFTLRPGDLVAITIPGVGTLRNPVAS